MIPSPRDLNEICHWYNCPDHQQTGCRYCAEGEETMNQVYLNDVVKFGVGREATGAELLKHSAGEQLVHLAKRYQRRHGVGFSEAFREVARVCPGELKAYLQFIPQTLPANIGQTISPDSTRDDSQKMPRGAGREVSSIEFKKVDGWKSEETVLEWLEEQGFVGLVTGVEGGWTYKPDPGKPAFPR